MNVGFIGLGAMGLPMATLIQEGGHHVTAFDIDNDRLSIFRERGGSAAKNPREATADAAVVMASLPSPEASVQAIEDPDTGVVAGMSAGSCLIEFSTVPLGQVQRQSAICRQAGIGFLDAPVSQAGGSVHDGALLIMVGGEAEVFAEYTPLLQILASRLMYLGPAGAGTLTKLLTQYVGFTTFVTLAEATVAAEAAGVDVGQFLDAVALSPGRSYMAEAFAEWRTEDPDSRSVRAPMYLINKDIGLAVDAIDTFNIPPLTGKVAADLYQQALKNGPKESFMTVLDVLRDHDAPAAPVAESPKT